MALYHRHVIGRPGLFVTFMTAEPLGIPFSERFESLWTDEDTA